MKKRELREAAAAEAHLADEFKAERDKYRKALEAIRDNEHGCPVVHDLVREAIGPKPRALTTGSTTTKPFPGTTVTYTTSA